MESTTCHLWRGSFSRDRVPVYGSGARSCMRAVREAAFSIADWPVQAASAAIGDELAPWEWLDPLVSATGRVARATGVPVR